MPKQYAITLPDSWYCNIAGAAAINLRCVTAYGQKIFVQSFTSELPLPNADETVNVYYEGDGSISEAVVEPDEQKIEKGIITLGAKQALKLLSRQNDTFILRYLIKENDKLYVFRVEAKDLTEIKDMTALLETIIHSMQFIS